MAPDYTALAQAWSVVVVLVAVGAWAMAQPIDSATEATVETLLLAIFAENSLGDVIDRQWFLTSSSDAAAQKSPLVYRIDRFLLRYAALKQKGYVTDQDGALPPDSKSSKLLLISQTIGIAAVIILIAPGFSWIVSEYEDSDEYYSLTKIIDPTERAAELVYRIGILAALVLWVVAVFGYFVNPTFRLLALLLLVIPLVFLLRGIYRVAQSQKRWKEYWLSRISEVLQRAAVANDHDLFASTHRVYESVKAEPLLPLTDVQRAVLITAGIVQITLVTFIPFVIRVWSYHFTFVP